MMNEFDTIINQTECDSTKLSNISCKSSNTNQLKACDLTVRDLLSNLERLRRSEGYICTEEVTLTNSDENWFAYVTKQLLARDKLNAFLYELIKKLIIIRKRSQTWIDYYQRKDKRQNKKIQELINQRRKREKFLKERKFLHQKITMSTHTEKYSDNYNCHNKNENSDVNYDKCEPNYKETTLKVIPLEDHTQELESQNKKKQLLINCEMLHLGDKRESGDDSEATHDPHSLHNSFNLTLNSEESLNVENEPAINGGVWNSCNIKEEVQKLAEEITNNLGYVFVDEIGMYYDHSSGYYYDPKTSLYYDGKSGTYFYYDYETNKYTFHAQVSPTVDEESNSVKAPNRKKETKEETEKEEGECSNSEEENVEIEEEMKSNYGQVDCEIAPSLRLMVINGKLKGELHVVTIDGGLIGREGNMQVLIKDPSVSKVHAEITYKSCGPSDHHYLIEDLGSINGTTVQEQRLSESRMRSDPVEIGHGWKIKCGDVLLCCHIHPGLLTCNECEPGLVYFSIYEELQSINVKENSKKKLEKNRRRQNKAIRKKFSLEGSSGSPPIKKTTYRDRAGERRDAVGSDNPYEKTDVASIDKNIAKTNKGFQLLEKMGWSEGQGLGLNKAGLTEPIIPICTSGRTGLGSSAALTAEESLGTNPRNSKTKMLKIMKEKSKLLPALESSSSVVPVSGEFQRIEFKPASIE